MPKESKYSSEKDYNSFIENAENLIRNGELRKAIQELSEFIIQPNDGNKEFQFRATLLRGIAQRKSGNYKLAINDSNKALEIASSIEQHPGVASCYNNIGIIYKEQGKYDKALDNYFKSLELRQSIGDLKNSANVLNNIGIIYNYLGLTDKSEEVLLKSLKVRIKSGDKADIAASYNNLGAFYYGQNNYPKALDFYSQSLLLKEKIDDVAGIAITYNNIGVIHKKNGDIDNAIEFHKKSLEIREKLNDFKGIIVSKINLANDYLDKGDFESCEQLVKEAMSHTEKLGNDSLLVKCYSTLTELKEMQGDYKNSLKYNKMYYQLQSSILSKETHNKISQLQANHEAEIQRFRNEKLGKLIKKIRLKNQELRRHKSFLRFINKILRHDVKNKLASTISSYRLFEHEGDEQYLKSGVEAVQASIQIIDRMKELESMISDNPQMSIYNIYETILQVLKCFPEMKADITDLDKHFDILADSALPSIFDNIIANILSHSGVKDCKISSTRRDKWLEIRISDKGKGVPKNLQDEIFKEGFTFGENSNTGMGLYIVKKNIERYGGFIYCETNKPKGTIFIINLKPLN